MKDTNNKKLQRISNFEISSKMIGIGIAVAVLILIMTILIFVENDRNKAVIKNKTDMKLEYVRAYFVDAEGPVNEGFKTEAINVDESLTVPTEEVELLYSEANLEVRFKFENMEEQFVDAGIFNETFNGKVTIDFNQTSEDEIDLKIKASNGLLSSQMIDCDEDFVYFLKEGYVDQK